MNHVAFIINPFSAQKNYQPFLELLKKSLEKPVIFLSDSVEGTEKFIKENFDHIDIFVAVGGDGTISSVAKNLILTDKILAIFPAGSGNGFSNENNFTKNLVSLLGKIKNGNHRAIDTFMVNEHFSINVSGTGFDGKVVKDFEKTSRGFSNYIKVSLRTFFRFKTVEIQFKAKEFQQHNGNYLMINVANTRQFGNNAYIAPHASTMDGLAEIVLVKKFPIWYSGIFAVNMFAKKLKKNRYLTYLSVPEIEFSVDSEDWHLDGEYTVIKSPIHVKVLPKSLKILV
ncbi:lipid kinase, YegS/Rv2252/BmrU family [Kaistella treverensis]|uniref:Lipid kinase, YegS/Rv2252/BmrU family n=1 Tax=Kaistella treverensis TaxID=631455 RepID=A0A1I3JRL1_9FLAO|nr:diacylglycerol kinase family protein [Kaistella treverensis]SFI62565.1 lipid kinase, YegS/Rv2252/BmrU family [Kaistella treverensis]